MNININDYFNYADVDEFIKPNGREYSDQMAELLMFGLIRDASFYEWCILNFNEIMDKEYGAITYVFSKINFIKQFFVSKDPAGVKETLYLNFGRIFAEGLHEYFKDTFTYAECLGLGIIASSDISYKREMLSKEEFYEIRDMFVPFGLTISLDKYDVNAVLDNIKGNDNYDEYMKNFVLLKKTGKATLYDNVTEDELEMALNNLIVEWD